MGNVLHQVKNIYICFEHADSHISVRYLSKKVSSSQGAERTRVHYKHWKYRVSIFPGEQYNTKQYVITHPPHPTKIN